MPKLPRNGVVGSGKDNNPGRSSSGVASRNEGTGANNNMSEIIESAESIEKPKQNRPDPVITDLNMAVIMACANGKSQTQVAKEFGVSPPAINKQIKRVKQLLEVKHTGQIDDPVNNHRARLIKCLKATEAVFAYTFKPKTFKKSSANLAIANTSAVAVNKGVGAFVDKTENLHSVDALTQHRQDMQARIDAARQFGLSPDQEIKPVVAEVIETIEDDNKAEIDTKL